MPTLGLHMQPNGFGGQWGSFWAVYDLGLSQAAVNEPSEIWICCLSFYFVQRVAIFDLRHIGVGNPPNEKQMLKGEVSAELVLS